MTSPSKHQAHIIGLGLIGCSIALALRDIGWEVSGEDLNPETQGLAVERSIVSCTEALEGVELVVIATPASAVADLASGVLADNSDPKLIVTDVAGVKSSIAALVSDSRFVPGHPMAGSELRGVLGARPDLFRGCTWVLTPGEMTDSESYSRLHAVLRELGAQVIALAPAVHDRLVATASHIPHLVAGALMNEATAVATEDEALLQLAAGGFRDMTRISAGDPVIWPDILIENADTILPGLASLQSRIDNLQRLIADGNATALFDELSAASVARQQLPGRAVPTSELVYIRIPVPDRPGVLSEITTAAGDMSVNIYDIEIAHSVEGQAGTLLLAIGNDQLDRFSKELAQRGFDVVRDRES
jgi:prephenate dehydrogenase